jgi:hypothetical protein
VGKLLFVAVIATVLCVTTPTTHADSEQDSVLVVSMSGSPEERGMEYGTVAKEGIAVNLRLFWEDIEDSGLSKIDILQKAARNSLGLPEDVRKEIKATAEGAEVDYGDLLAMNLFGTSLGGMGGCTQFVAAGSGTVDGEVVASKNRDANTVNILMIMKPTDDSHGFIGVTGAGYWGASFGLNDVGLCDGNNWMPVPDDSFFDGGYPEITLNRMVLEKCADVDEAIAFVDEQPKYGGSTIMVADPVKAAFIETVPSDGEGYTLNPEVPDIVTRVVTDGVECHTNHYMYEPYYSMVLYDGFGTMWTPSIARYDNGMDLIEEAGNVVSAEQVISFCRDLEDFGNSHPNWIKDEHPEIPWECWEDGWPGFSICNTRTVSSGVFELNSERPDMLSRMWTAIYNPCWCPYVPLRNALVAEADDANDALMPYRDGTAWLVSMRLRTVEENDWGCLLPVFEDWEDDARVDAEVTEAQAEGLVAAGDEQGAFASLTEHDCAKALEAIELMISLGSWVNGEYDLMSAGEGLRSGEVGEKQA